MTAHKAKPLAATLCSSVITLKNYSVNVSIVKAREKRPTCSPQTDKDSPQFSVLT